MSEQGSGITKVAVKKKAVSKKRATSKKTTVKNKTVTAKRKNVAKKMAVSDAVRRQMVAEAAYYIAEKRGFNGGDVHDDWHQAEKQIDASYRVVE